MRIIDLDFQALLVNCLFLFIVYVVPDYKQYIIKYPHENIPKPVFLAKEILQFRAPDNNRLI